VTFPERAAGLVPGKWFRRDKPGGSLAFPHSGEKLFFDSSGGLERLYLRLERQASR